MPTPSACVALGEGAPNLDRDCLGHRKQDFRVARRNQWSQLGIAPCENALDQLRIPIGYPDVTFVESDGNEDPIGLLPQLAHPQEHLEKVVPRVDSRK